MLFIPKEDVRDMNIGLIGRLSLLFVLFFFLGCLTEKKTPDTYDPCENHECGEVCSPCSAEDPDCVAPGAMMLCNAARVCVATADERTLCDPQQCIPGSTFESADGCNTCQCPASGLRDDAACSTRMCGQTECTPGARFDAEDGCNVCICPENGLRAEAACTERACADLCTPGESFGAADGCNECQCPESGRRDDAACTRRACISSCGGLRCGARCSPDEGGAGFGASDEEQGGAGPAVEEVLFACNFLGQCVQENGEDLHCMDQCHQIVCGETCRDLSAPFPNEMDDAEESEGAPDRERVAPQPNPVPRLCNADGQCIESDGSDLICPEAPNPCADLACGDPCIESGEVDAQGGAGDRAPAPTPTPTLCNADGACVPVRDPAELMCDDARCDPGSQIPAGDGCNNCLCPESGLRAEANECTEIACGHPDCLARDCGSMCDPNAGKSGDPDADGQGAAGAPIAFICNVAQQCVEEGQDPMCGQ
jgi:hypothetical protein